MNTRNPGTAADRSPAAVVLQQVAAGYGETPVLQDLSLSIPAGRITVILGGSGCGKSTLLKTMLRLTPALAGRIELLGHDLLGLGENSYDMLLREIGVLFQGGALINSLSLCENVAMPLEQHTDLPDDMILQLVHRQLASVGLADDLWKLPGELSGGMRKRAALARAMILNPAVLFCDEPSAGLDPVTAAELDALLLRLRQQYSMTIVVVTHELASIHRIADELIFLHNGGCIFQGSPACAVVEGPTPVREFFAAGAIS
ncbi:ABC transporter ATP-binding protein [Spirochaeta africana]|uniref:ABC-type transport system involved in resistance to organic solvents, ATPase component n=1 Tax=Spirochaeta africana (strain ATCC 700263 / DSM 8902 / Z-7692) TaxID=889378 RepID=H9UGG1_SPIAZ|nr:ATP-binding cassette domain-containing protein [Spirochaeta africana]AFG36604.1 ABC-type transport system involved in resistance to organic solvents, ATPase component [Spirochaeta africana DSM 8902]